MLDKIGATLSFFCLIHCLVLPWVVLFLPLNMFMDERVHFWLFLLLAPVALLAIWNGYLTHGKKPAFYLMLSGLVFIGLPVFHHLAGLKESIITVIGSIQLISGHLLNRKYLRMHGVHHAHDHSQPNDYYLVPEEK